MNCVLILYPTLFKSYSKFSRKLSMLIANLASPRLVFIDDKNEFGAQYTKQHNLAYERIEQPLTKALHNITHAIVFSDGEVFVDEVKALRQGFVKTSVQRIKITRVVNVTRDPVYNGRQSTEQFEYIGRGSPWGNPYPIGIDGDDRNEVLRKYKYDFDYDNFLNITKVGMLALAGKRLGCFCKPDDCHGDFIADYLNTYDDGQ
ncbi:DUF4326 domain-containing protein [Vibrio sp. VB16]|uniref:DUF4326 domain-containing protein n=1 Tax=Vibrio sp. VB16 TaxID=2785746 RepID=UPI003FCD3530